MALNAKMKAYIDEQVTAGKMSKEYGETLAKTMGDAPDEFQGAFLRQSDYDRLVNENKAAHKKNLDWYEGANKEYVGMKEAKDAADATITAANAKITDLEAKLSSGGLTAPQETQVTKELAELKTTLSEFKTQLSGGKFIEADKVATMLDDKAKEVVGFMSDNFLTLDEIGNRHQEVFGKRFTADDKTALFTYANEQSQKIGRKLNLTEAYELKHKEDLEKHKETTLRTQIEKEVLTRTGVPQATGSEDTAGPLRIRMEGKLKDGLPADASLQEAAMAGAAALRAAGKA